MTRLLQIDLLELQNHIKGCGDEPVAGRAHSVRDGPQQRTVCLEDVPGAGGHSAA